LSSKGLLLQGVPQTASEAMDSYDNQNVKNNSSAWGMDNTSRDCKMIYRLSVLLSVVMILGIFVGPVGATPYTFSNSSGDLAASVTFDVLDTNRLTVTLTNTSAADVLRPADVLTAVFFDLDGVTGLDPDSALLNESNVLFGPDGGGNVGGEWAYAEGLTGAPLGADMGISSAGFGLFGDANFDGVNLQDPTAVNGLNYGITSAGDKPLTGNTSVTGGLNKNGKGNPVALIQNSVIFTLNGLPAGFNPDTSISKVSFQYGTDLDLAVPEPSTLLLLGSCLIGLAGLSRKKFFKE